MPKKKLSFNVEEFKQREETFKEALSNEPDRGAVLVAAAYLEEKLELLLYVYFQSEKAFHNKASINGKEFNTAFEELLGSPSKPLGSFSSKINLVYLLGLLTEWEYRDLETIRKIRNNFAHQIESASFKNADTAGLIKNLLDHSREEGTRFKRKVRYMAHLIITRIVIMVSDLSLDDKRKGMLFPEDHRFKFEIYD